jgi:hypothetical protein
MRIQKHNLELFSQWSTTKETAESMHPILKEVWCRYLFEQYEHEYNHSYRAGNDPNRYRKWIVVHVSAVSFLDVREESVIWQLIQVPKHNYITLGTLDAQHLI